jgi:dUTP pyrophosphatase
MIPTRIRGLSARALGNGNTLMRFKTLYVDSAPLRSPTEGNAGYDIPMYGDVVIPPGTRFRAKTGIVVEVPVGFGGFVLGRSGNAFKRDAFVAHIGLIDSTYRGEVGVLLENKSDEPWYLSTGDLIAQLVILPVYTEQAVEVSSLTSTERGENGFGSTGLAGLFGSAFVEEVTS